MNQWKSAYAAKTKARTLAEALDGADAFFGLSAKGAVTQGDGASRWRTKPIIFAMANPDPEITPEDVAGGARRRHRGHRPLRLSQPDQQRAGLPLHLPRRARRAGLDHQRGDEDRRRPGAGRARPRRGARPGGRRLPRPPADVRARLHHPGAVRPAPHRRMCRRPSPRRRWIPASRAGRSSTWTPTSAASRAGSIRSPAGCSRPSTRCAHDPKRVDLRRGRGAGRHPRRQRLLHARLRPADAGRHGRARCKDNFKAARHQAAAPSSSCSTRASRPTPRSSPSSSMRRLQRHGYLRRDCQRLVLNERNVFAALMVVHGYADAHGVGRHAQLDAASTTTCAACSTPSPAGASIGVSLALCRGRAVLIADTSVHDMPTAEELADIADRGGARARATSASSRASRCSPTRPSASRAASAPTRCARRSRSSTERSVDFEYDGDMAADVALNPRPDASTIRSAG